MTGTLENAYKHLRVAVLLSIACALVLISCSREREQEQEEACVPIEFTASPAVCLNAGIQTLSQARNLIYDSGYYEELNPSTPFERLVIYHESGSSLWIEDKIAFVVLSGSLSDTSEVRDTFKGIVDTISTHYGSDFTFGEQFIPWYGKEAPAVLWTEEGFAIMLHLYTHINKDTNEASARFKLTLTDKPFLGRFRSLPQVYSARDVGLE